MKRIFMPLVVLMTIFFASCNFGNLSDGNTSTGSGGSTSSDVDDSIVTVSKENADVLAVFNLTNDFRTGSEAKYLNKDNTTETSLVGKLGKLTLDDDLCRVAKIRSKEIVKSFSHTRPNGTSCFTAFDECSVVCNAKGENIAAGYLSGDKTFLQWKEDNEKYEGQGHRRNMLGDFTKIGLARSYDPDSKYKYYWVMVLAK